MGTRKFPAILNSLPSIPALLCFKDGVDLIEHGQERATVIESETLWMILDHS